MTARFSLRDLGRSIPLPAIQGYLSSHDWQTSVVGHALVCVGPLDDQGIAIQSIIPVSEDSREYGLRVEDLLATLSAVEDRPSREIAQEILRRIEEPASMR